MIRINLLPERKKVKRTTAQQFLAIYLLAVVLTLGGVLWLWIGQNHDVERLRRREAFLRREVGRYARYDKMLRDMKKQKKMIDERIKVIRALERDRDQIVRTMALLSLSLPRDKMWFESLNLSGKGAAIKGMALSDEAIAEFMRRLEASPFVQRGSVSLSHSKLRMMGNMRLREFQLSCSIYPYSKVKTDAGHSKKP